ncbi:MAG: YceI family protein [Thermomicrobiales bacterium]|nr:YceI family protein [Thermomicrobiales bacterium]
MNVATLQRTETSSGAGTIWTIDPLHSTIAFSIKHLKVATVHGRFGGFRGTIRFDVGHPSDAAVEAAIDAASIDTGNAKRDQHLRSADFFDVAAYPTIVFRGARVEPVDPLRRDRWRMAGDLTLHGVTRPVELDVRQTGGPNLWDLEVASFAATTKISRKEFGIGLNLPLDGGLVIGDEVSIAIDIQVVEGPIGGR